MLLLEWQWISYLYIIIIIFLDNKKIHFGQNILCSFHFTAEDKRIHDNAGTVKYW